VTIAEIPSLLINANRAEGLYMKKAFLLSLLSFCLTSGLFAQEAARIAVLDFKTNGTPQFIGNAVADIITTELKRDKDIVILERIQIQRIMKEQSYQATGCTDTSCAVEFGQLLSVKKIVIGSVSLIGDSYTITGKIVEIKSGAIEFAESESCANINDIESAARYLAVKLLNRISSQYHDLPVKSYSSKYGTKPVEVSIGARYGITWGFKVPEIKSPAQYPEKIKISPKKQNVDMIEGVLAVNRFISKNISVKGSVKYGKGGFDDETYVIKPIEHPTDTYRNSYSFYGKNINCLGAGAGLQYTFNMSELKPFLALGVFYNRYWFDSTPIGTYSFDAQSGINTDTQNYRFELEQYSDVVSAECEFGIKVFFINNFGIIFSTGVNIPFYGSVFRNFEMTKAYEDINNNLIPEEYKDLNNKLKLDEKDFRQPPAYFVHLGFVYRL